MSNLESRIGHSTFSIRHSTFLFSEGNSSAGEVVGRHLDGDGVAGQDADIILPHLAGDVGEDVVFLSAGVHLDAEGRVGQRRNDYALYLNGIGFAHAVRSSKAPSLARTKESQDLVRDIDTRPRRAPHFSLGPAETRLE